LKISQLTDGGMSPYDSTLTKATGETLSCFEQADPLTDTGAGIKSVQFRKQATLYKLY
jgi:hypothetical protein